MEKKIKQLKELLKLAVEAVNNLKKIEGPFIDYYNRMADAIKTSHKPEGVTTIAELQKEVEAIKSNGELFEKNIEAIQKSIEDIKNQTTDAKRSIPKGVRYMNDALASLRPRLQLVLATTAPKN